MDEPRTLVACLASHPDDIEAYYAAVHELAGDARVYRDGLLQAWVVTGYGECAQLLGDPRLVRARLALPRGLPADDVVDFAQRVLDAQMMFSDDPGVASRRRYWSQVVVGGLDGYLDKDLPRLAAAAIDAAPAGAEIEAYSGLLQPYVSRVVCARLALGERERSQIYSQLMRYVRFLDGKVSRAEELEAALLSIVTLYAQLAGKRDAFAADGGDRHQWASDYLLTLAAGHESTAYLLGTVLLHAGDELRSMAAARSDRRRIARFVAEALRYDSPVQLMGRRVREEISINGHALRAGDRVFLHVAAANRDPRTFERPTEFDPDRDGPPPLSFGWGEHQCIGRSLAVKEAFVFLSTLVEQGRSLAIDRERVERSSGLAGRSFRALPARLQNERTAHEWSE